MEGMEQPQRKKLNTMRKVIAVVAGLTGITPAAAEAQQKPLTIESIISEQQRLEKMIDEIQKAPIYEFGPDFFSAEDLKCLTDNVYHEARGEVKEGKYAVMFTTLSRVLDKRYPKTVCGVVHQPWQFSWTHDQKILAQPINLRAYREIETMVKNLTDKRTIEEATILAGMHAGLRHGALFYKRVGFEGSPKVQEFFASLQSIGNVGNHEFFVRKSGVSN